MNGYKELTKIDFIENDIRDLKNNIKELRKLYFKILKDVNCLKSCRKKTKKMEN